MEKFHFIDRVLFIEKIIVKCLNIKLILFSLKGSLFSFFEQMDT